MYLREASEITRELFRTVFGETPLSQRLKDILGEANELSRFTTLANLREETGDLLASVLVLCDEAGFDPVALLAENKTKILRRREQYRSLGRKVRTAVLGGAFNPIHVGHIAVAKFILNASCYFDEVWLMPCFAHPYAKNMASTEHRLAMCAIAAKGDPRIKVSDFETTRELSGETFQTSKLLIEEFKDKREFHWVIGMDNANTAEQKWVNFSELEKMMPFVVVPRPGEQRTPSVKWYLHPPHIFLEPDSSETLINISSSEIRDDIPQLSAALKECALGKSGLFGLDRGVLEYIVRNKLYL